MSTGTDIITDALKKIGVVSVVSPANPESIEDGRKELNAMMEMWLSEGIVLATSPLEVAGNDLNEPGDCRMAIVNNLAIQCAPLFDNGKTIVSPDLRTNARVGLNSVKSLYRQTTIPKKVLSSTTPVGAGNSLNTRYARTFWEKGAGVDN